MNKNYSSICWYCGELYRSNRLTSKFCSSLHRSLFHKNGSQIPPTVVDRNGKCINADELLSRIDYNLLYKDPEGWSYAYNLDSIIYKYDYRGPLPSGSELILAGSYLITRLEDHTDCFFAVKPIFKLTKEERIKFKIIKASSNFDDS